MEESFGKSQQINCEQEYLTSNLDVRKEKKYSHREEVIFPL